jgi:hypothetical protein
MGNEVCGYDNWESVEGYPMSCQLPKGHEGDHQETITWATRPSDICRAEGHVWGEWQAFTEYKPNLFAHAREWKVDPTSWRRCDRCRMLNFEGGERNPDISDFLLRSLLPGTIVIPGPLSPEMQVKLTEWKV